MEITAAKMRRVADDRRRGAGDAQSHFDESGWVWYQSYDSPVDYAYKVGWNETVARLEESGAGEIVIVDGCYRLTRTTDLPGGETAGKDE